MRKAKPTPLIEIAEGADFETRSDLMAAFVTRSEQLGRKSIDRTAQQLLGAIFAVVKTHGRVHWTYAEIAQRLMCSASTARRALSRLEEMDLIEREICEYARGGQGANYYNIKKISTLFLCSEVEQPGVQNEQPGVQNEQPGVQNEQPYKESTSITKSITASIFEESRDLDRESPSVDIDASDPESPAVDDDLRGWLEWWNSLKAMEPPLVCSGAHVDKPSEAVKRSWRAVKRSPELQSLIDRRDEIETQLRASSFARQAGWLRPERLLSGRNKDGEYIVKKLIEGGYVDRSHERSRGPVVTAAYKFDPLNTKYGAGF